MIYIFEEKFRHNQFLLQSVRKQCFTAFYNFYTFNFLDINKATIIHAIVDFILLILIVIFLVSALSTIRQLHV